MTLLVYYTPLSHLIYLAILWFFLIVRSKADLTNFNGLLIAKHCQAS